MKKVSIVLLFFVQVQFIIAQENNNKDLFAFAITDYMVNTSDSVCIVQVALPTNIIKIEEKELGLLNHNFTNNKIDTNSIGFGRCHLIKENYYYFGIRLSNKSIKPVANDVLYAKIIYPANYMGNIYSLIKKGIYFTKVNDEKLYDFETATVLTEAEENGLIDLMVADIRYTGKVMKEQIPNQNKRIEGGIFNGIKLFTGMETCTADEVKKFIDYVIARPSKYAGNTWKISETFATWMDAGTPTVIK